MENNSEKKIGDEKKIKSDKNIKLRTRLKERRVTPFSVFALAPSFIGVMLFYIVPMCFVMYYSVLDNTITKNFVGMKNFEALFKNDAFITAAKNTVVLSLITVPPAVIISMLFAMAMENNIPYKSGIRAMLLSPVMVPAASVVLVWQVFFHYNGILNSWTSKLLGLEPVDWLKSKYCLIVIALMFLWKNLGYNMILFMSAIAGMPKELIEVADLEGASTLYKFFMIKLRYISPSIIFVTILSIMNSFKLFREIYLISGDHPNENLYLLQHYMKNTFKSLDYQKLSSSAIVMMLVMIVIITILVVTDNHFGGDIEEG